MVPEIDRLLHLLQSVIHDGVKVLKCAEGFSVTLIDDAAEVREAEGAEAPDDRACPGIILEQVSGLHEMSQSKRTSCIDTFRGLNSLKQIFTNG